MHKNINCLSCEKPLQISLSPDAYAPEIECISCGSGVAEERLIQSGIPNKVVKRINCWCRQICKINAYCHKASDEHDTIDNLNKFTQLLKNSWKLRQKLNLSLYFPTAVFAVDEIFDPSKNWDQQEITAWYQQNMRYWRISDYGSLLGLEHLKKGHPFPEKINCPTIFTVEEKECFQNGFIVGYAFENYTATMTIKELEQLLGIKNV